MDKLRDLGVLERINQLSNKAHIKQIHYPYKYLFFTISNIKHSKSLKNTHTRHVGCFHFFTSSAHSPWRSSVLLFKKAPPSLLPPRAHLHRRRSLLRPPPPTRILHLRYKCRHGPLRPPLRFNLLIRSQLHH